MEIDYGFIFQNDDTNILEEWKLFEKRMIFTLGDIITEGIFKDYLVKMGLWESAEPLNCLLTKESYKLFLLLTVFVKAGIQMTPDDDGKNKRIAISEAVLAFVKFHKVKNQL